MIYRYIIIIVWFVCLFPQQGITQQVEVKNNSFYIDGQKFFVKGIGYEAGALPGQLPWSRTYNPGQLQFDIQRIISGGFNTIRTWAPLTAQELNLLQQYNIRIIMGIWIDPNGNFADAQFVSSAKAIVANVLSYSKNYNNIIAYLIMNEAQPEAIFREGYQNTANLWKELINIIHTQHPNRPVSIANTCTGTYIESNLFDFSAYNVYIYNPVTVNYLHGYRDYISYLQQLNQPDHPLIITEYGLSVSPIGESNWGYGGNSLTQQQEGDLHMYKSLVDGGANGSCVFNYSDGWWKAGNESVHDNTAEEWFGLVEYSSLSDKQGQVRPVWNAVRDYQSAIITQPKSSEIYINKVPVEIFFNDTIKRIEVLFGNAPVYQKQVETGYLTDSIVIDFQNIKDVVLQFNCYDKQNNLVKSEDKNILITATKLALPTIQISTNSNCWETGSVDVNYQINKTANFTTDSKLDYIYYPHVGWDYGQKFQATMPVDNLNTQYVINSNVNVFTLGAAFNISYNGFQKCIINQLTLSRFNLNSNVVDEITETAGIKIFPNPSSDYIVVRSDNTVSAPYFDFVIYNTSGMIVKQGSKTLWNTPIKISSLESGMYTIRINHNNQNIPVIKKLLKL